MNNIVKSVLKGTDSSLFVDDFALYVRGWSVQRVERERELYMELRVNGVQNWVSENGFKFSPSKSKTACNHFL